MSYDPPVRKLEDDASANADAGVPILAVRKAAPANTSGTDGDYEFLQMSGGRVWCSATIDAALPTGANVIGGVTQSGAWNVGTVTTVTTVSSVTNLAQMGGQPISLNAGAPDAGTLRVTMAYGATGTGKAEDVASADGDVGVPAMAVRKATPANTSGTDGDYEMLQMAGGRLWASVVVDTALPAGTNNIGDVDVLTLPAPLGAAGAGSIAKAEDAASADGDVGVPAYAVRKATPANTSGTDGDYEPLQVNGGRLWASATIDAALPAGTNNIGDVDVLSLPSLPAGTNNIGDVDVLSLPALPAGTNNIGDVDVLTLPALPAGTNNIGDVDVLTLPSIPAGNNNIGDVDVVTLPAPFGAAGAASIAKAEDVASANADVGVPFMFTQRVTPSNLADANGDYEIAQGYQGALWTRRPNVIGTAATLTALDAVVAAPGGLGVTQSGSSTAGSIVAEAAIGGENSFALFVSGGSFTGTIYFEGSVNSGNGTTGSWVSIPMRREGVWMGQQHYYGHSAAGASSNAIYRGSCAGFTYVRARLVGTVHTTSPTVSIVLSAANILVPLVMPVTSVDPGATYRGACATFRTPGRAGTTGQKIFAIHNATGSTKIVKVKNLYVDLVQTVVKAITVLPPVVRAHRVTVLPTNGTAGSKVARDSGMSSSSSLTVFQDASADGTSSGTALTATIPAGSCFAQEFAPRFITAAGYEAADRIRLLGDDEIALRALEGIVVNLDYVLATQNPLTDMWTVGCDWEEK